MFDISLSLFLGVGFGRCLFIILSLYLSVFLGIAACFWGWLVFVCWVYTFVFLYRCFSREGGVFVGFLKDEQHSTGVRGFGGFFLDFFLFLAKVIHFLKIFFRSFFLVCLYYPWRESGGGGRR
jgi:hypothetical protein